MDKMQLPDDFIFAEDPASDAAFIELWDLDSASCDVFEEIIDPDSRMFPL